MHYKIITQELILKVLGKHRTNLLECYCRLEPRCWKNNSFAVEETNHNHIIAGANTGGVWRSADGGSTWAVLTDNLSNIDVYALAIDPLVNTTYYWGSTNGAIFKSTDSRATWSLHSSLPGGTVNKISIHPTNTSTIFASAESGGIYKSFDSCLTWTIIHTTPTTVYDI